MIYPQELQCKKAQKAFLACALANDFNATSNLWKNVTDASCYAAAATGLAGCRGGFATDRRRALRSGTI